MSGILGVARHPALGFQQITALTAATKLAVPIGAVSALITVEGAPVRWRDDDVPPTATVGMPLNVGDVLNYDGPVRAVQFIQMSAGAVLNINYYA